MQPSTTLVAIQYFIRGICHNLFTYYWRALGQFQFFAIIIHLRTVLYMSFGEHIFEFLLGIYLREELLSHRTCMCSALVDSNKQYYRVMGPICTPTSSTGEFQLLYILINTLYFLLSPLWWQYHTLLIILNIKHFII